MWMTDKLVGNGIHGLTLFVYLNGLYIYSSIQKKSALITERNVLFSMIIAT